VAFEDVGISVRELPVDKVQEIVPSKTGKEIAREVLKAQRASVFPLRWL
jgi:hypothetical protein